MFSRFVNSTKKIAFSESSFSALRGGFLLPPMPKSHLTSEKSHDIEHTTDSPILDDRIKKMSPYR